MNSERLKALRARFGAFGARVKRAPWAHIAAGAATALGGAAAILVLTLALADWNALRGPVANVASGVAGRQISIDGDLDVHAFSLMPTVIANDVRVANPRWIDGRRQPADMARIERAAATVQLLDLLVGRVTLRSVELDRPVVALYRREDGRSNWSSQRDEPLKLPAIRRFVLRDGFVRVTDDKRNMRLSAGFTSDEGGERGGEHVFQLSGEGRINAQPFTLRITGESLLNVDRSRPYAFNADLRAADTRIRARGSVDRPFDLSAYRADVRASGADLADLYTLFAITLPNTPPYQLQARMRRTGAKFTFNDLNGRVGDSDLAGAFSVIRGRQDGRTLLEADVRSRSLDWDDLLAVLGGAPSTAPGETASPAQRAMAARLEAQERLLPNARLNIQRVRNMDAKVRYRAARVSSKNWPVRSFAADVTLDNGLLTLSPVRVGLARGSLAGDVRLNARGRVPETDVDVRLADARIETILPRVGGAVRGALRGRVRLHGTGDTVREAAAASRGTVTLVVPRGEVREALAELTGINVTRGLGLLFSDDQSTTPIRCGVASFDVRGGVMHARSILIDAEDVVIRGGGRVDLRNERVDLKAQGHPKEFRLIRVQAPITIRGPLRDPDVGVDAEEALDQGGIGAALSVALAPFAAILAFVDPGLAEDTDCRAVLAEARNPPSDPGRRPVEKEG